MKNCFDIIVAMDLNSGIGKGGGLPWHLPADLKHFKQLTATTRSPSRKNAVIMGRKTWESLPEKFRPLPDRINAVVTRNKDLVLPQGVLNGDSLEGVLNRLSAMTSEVENIFVIGGAQIFRSALTHPGCRKIYATQILKKFDCDTFFPPLDSSWKQISKSPRSIDHSLEYCFSQYVKALSR
ncbi:MAG TPA: dihydrofolate reductase [Candidatus Omnitrophota bacterium]|nr:dihydrofolate reductase [Candidatus Omnitrophota bacterium]